MEFLRFGSSIPGGYWGCCACCIIQNFKVEPDAKASIQLVSGDGGGPMMKGSESLFAGPTYRDIFHQRIRSGTFDTRDMPNHAFLAILTQNQIEGSIGQKWLAILREAGFEFIRTVCNSVYAGQTLLGNSAPSNQSKNYIFGLFRNIGAGAISDPFTPPPQWTNLPKPNGDYVEAWDLIADGGEGVSGQLSQRLFTAQQQRKSQLEIWNKIGPAKFLTESEIVAAGAPVTLAGLRSEFPQEPKEVRDNKKKAKGVAPVVSMKGCSPAPTAVTGN